MKQSLTKRLISTIKFEIGQIVYLKTDVEQNERMITAISLKPDGILYCLSCGTSETYHSDIEICEEINVIKKYNITVSKNEDQ